MAYSQGAVSRSERMHCQTFLGVLEIARSARPPFGFPIRIGPEHGQRLPMGALRGMVIISMAAGADHTALMPTDAEAKEHEHAMQIDRIICCQRCVGNFALHRARQ